jgi:hypothetical protein
MRTNALIGKRFQRCSEVIPIVKEFSLGIRGPLDLKLENIVGLRPRGSMALVGGSEH